MPTTKNSLYLCYVLKYLWSFNFKLKFFKYTLRDFKVEKYNFKVIKIYLIREINQEYTNIIIKVKNKIIRLLRYI